MHLAKAYLYLISIFFVLIGIGGVTASFFEKDFAGIMANAGFVFFWVLGYFAALFGILPQRILESPTSNELLLLGVLAFALGLVSLYSVWRGGKFVYVLWGLASVLLLIVVDNILFAKILNFETTMLITVPFMLSVLLAVYVFYKKSLTNKIII